MQLSSILAPSSRGRAIFEANITPHVDPQFKDKPQVYAKFVHQLRKVACRLNR